jgi:hypothetical protein
MWMSGYDYFMNNISIKADEILAEMLNQGKISFKDYLSLKSKNIMETIKVDDFKHIN